ncbi:MAG: DEAD/DEAH box helicase [Mycobacterium sp.]|uniref:DEAD/DEAH box helicase n=1 Tax=Mycobacterium sp. TaxID=1785 RepID=UPI0026156AB4|nr:DEAD/DEAH box helicase [Mycobacterium sp.]MDI3314372.1 DEAD/DEAH box helicase [Mycobacterium sp.]
MTVTMAADQASAEDLSTYLPLLERLRNGARQQQDWSKIVDEAVQVWSRPGFDTFLAVPRLRFEPFDYQLQAARTVLRRMRGRGILADEVGLGKTIEAGLVLSELRMRGLADHALVIAPAGLVDQWRDELERKFGLPTTIAQSGSAPAHEAGTPHPVVIASLAAARRAPLLGRLTGANWDLVIFDEAHRLRNPRSASGRLGRGLRTRYLLMLTATPVENQLSDLYQLVSLVAPGLLGTPAQFRAKHGAASVESRPRNLDELRARTREVMVRHRRSEVAVMLPARLAETILVTPGADEAGLYADIVRRVRLAAPAPVSGDGAARAKLEGAGAWRQRAGQSASRTRLVLRGLTRLAGSSPAAAAPTLAKLGWNDLAQRARAIREPEKVRVLVELLRRHLTRGEKVLVFTGFRQTLEALAAAVECSGLPSAVYHGSLTRTEKESTISKFRSETPILLSTESAGEGRNLQFCHVMVNFDLPWNPMQIEQRLGRLHRVGQQHHVTLTNLVCRGSIEQRIVQVLESKINLFELVVGELDMILGRVDDDFDFENEVFDAFVDAVDDEEFERRLEALGAALAEARRGYLKSREDVDLLVGTASAAQPGVAGRHPATRAGEPS